ncbi:hypothetical protein OIV83_001812 [Microbotryomycetes sp. JL201]|nr:hypothetical protein OIV83_001812 [Microbotryomycetes sp. JL201]
MLSRLFKAQVISSGATWDAFSTAFNSEPTCNLVDCSSTTVASKMAATISLFTMTAPLHRIFVAGVHPSALAAEAEDEAAAVQQAVKLVVINHLESPKDGDFIAELGYPTTIFERLFSRDTLVATSIAHQFGGHDSDEDGSQVWSSPVSYKSSDTRKTTTHGEQGKRLRKIDPNKGFLNQDPQM